jgi:small subunit ribosomal protein S17
MEQETKKKKVNIVLQGTVLSSKADKTVIVNVERKFKHPVYKKIVRKNKKYLAHDENNSSQPGDIVKIKLVRPLSKLKRWMVVRDAGQSAAPKEVTK